MYDLAVHSSLGPRYAIVGFARSPMTDDSFRQTAGDAAKSISEVGPIDRRSGATSHRAFATIRANYGDTKAYSDLGNASRISRKRQPWRQTGFFISLLLRGLFRHHRADWQGWTG